MSNLHGWMFRAARAIVDLTREELASSAGIGVSSLKRIEASDVLDIRTDPDRKIDGGIASDVVERLTAELRRRGVSIRPAVGEWPACVVRVDA